MSDIVPKIRQELKILDSTSNSTKEWILFDPIQSKYFNLTLDSFNLISNWKSDISIDEFITHLHTKGLDIDRDDLEKFIHFLLSNSLIYSRDIEDTSYYYNTYKSTQHSFFKWLIHNYLYIKIPLLKPNEWLDDTLEYVSFFFSRWWSYFVFVLGFFGIVLVLRDFERFVSEFDSITMSSGVAYVVALIFIKMIHELGHAYSAKRLGCNVPTMGVALLVMFPVLYTDTTDAWRLTNKKDRLSIVLAGVKTELYIAMIATFLYSLTPSGIFQQMLFIIATTSWVSSIIMNISPFLRFDGYYALSDISDTKNLQPRSFAMAKWFIRREIIGIIEPRPEMVSRARESFFIIYAMATWVYRFFLFLGIAVMVYYFAFKLLGIVLFAVEIVWFILLPISKEIKVWYRYKKEININKYTVRTLSILVLLVVLFVWPWQKSITLDAIVESKEYTQLYAPKSAKIDKIYIKDKDIVKKGDTLIALSSKKLDSQIESLTLQTKLIKAQLKKIATEKELLNMKIVLQERLNKKYVALFSLQEAKENMIIKAPFDGVVSLKNIKNSMYISSDDVLVSIYNPNRLSVTAFCNSNQKDKIAIGDEAKVFFVNTILEPLEIRVDSISDISIATLEYLELSSQLGGDIETKIVDKNHITKEAYFKISSSITTAYYPMHYRTKAKMAIVVEDDSLASKFFTKAISVVIRESGF